MKNYWKDLVLVHDTSMFEKRYELFSARSLVQPARAVVVPRGIDPEYLSWLREPAVNLGPEKVIEVDGPNLFDGLEADQDALDAVTHEIRHKARLQPFIMTLETQEFLRRHGIRRENWHGPDIGMTRKVSDKLEARRIADSIGLKDYLLPYETARSPKAIRSKTAQALKAFGRVVIKRTDLASGDGLLFLTAGEPYDERLDAFLERYHANEIRIVAYRKEPDGRKTAIATKTSRDRSDALALSLAFLMDVSVAGIDLWRRDLLGTASMSFTKSDQERVLIESFLEKHQENEFIIEKAITCRSFTTQLLIGESKPFKMVGASLQHVDGSGRHIGDAVTRFPHPKRLPPEDWFALDLITMTIGRHLHAQINGYHGTIGVDVLKEKGAMAGEGLYLSSILGREAAVSYAFGINRQIHERCLGASADESADRHLNWGIDMYNALPTRARSFGELKRLIGKDLIFEATYGAIPQNVGLTGLDDPHCGMFFVADSIEKAEAGMKQVRERIA